MTREEWLLVLCLCLCGLLLISVIVGIHFTRMSIKESREQKVLDLRLSALLEKAITTKTELGI